MTTGGVVMPSLAQCSADNSEDRLLWTKRAGSLNVTDYWLKFTDDLTIPVWELSFIQTWWVEPRLVAAAVSADWSAKRS
jgi:hypothetical protein